MVVVARRAKLAILWVVAIGVLGLAVAATLLPEHAEAIAHWSVYFFVIVPALLRQ